jgi:O-antigen ligase
MLTPLRAADTTCRSIDAVMDASANSQRAMLAVFFVTTAAVAGMATVFSATLFGDRAAYYIAFFGLIGACALLAATRKEPMRFIFLALIAALPIASALVPPGRLGLTVFDVVMIVLAIGLVGRGLVSSPAVRQPIFPTRSLLIAWILCIPCVVLSQFPAVSALAFVLLFATYVFFLLCIAELRRERGFERLVALLCYVAIVFAIGTLIDYVWHVNLSLRGTGLNTLTYEEGIEVFRAGGFFQDPQRCGTFFSLLITFLLVVTVRGRLKEPGLRALVWLTIAAGMAALLMTISRSAILSCLLMSAVALFAFNAWSWHLKAAIAATFVVLATLVSQTSFDTWFGLLPITAQTRLMQIPEAWETRVDIWFDTWDMFEKHPATGIGFGSFREYLLQTRPGITNYYGIGDAIGVEYIPDQPESGWFKILYEGGVLGALAALLVGGDAIRRALRGAASATADVRTECIAAFAGLLTFAVTFTTLWTVGDPRIAALLAFFFAVIWSRSWSPDHSTHRA